MKCMIQKCILKCVTNNCKPPQSSDFQKSEVSLSFVSSEKIPYICYSHLMLGWNLLPVFCFIWS